MKTRKLWWIVLILLIGAWFTVPVCSRSAYAQPYTYTVQKGDTLWSICEKFYGNPDLWPKLWSMNSFITNPHLLKVGDVITLVEESPEKKTGVTKPLAAKPPVKAKAPMGVDAAHMTKVAALGFLSMENIRPAGRIFSARGQRLLLSKGDIVYVAIPRGRIVNPGDFYTSYGTSPPIKDPVNVKKTGILVYTSGRMVIRGAVSETVQEDVRKKAPRLAANSLYEAKILSSFREIHVGDPVMTWEPLSNCIRPLPAKAGLATHIFAVKNLDQMIGQWSVVYLADGYRHGIRRGNLLEIIERKKGDALGKGSFSQELLGYLLVIESRPETAGAVVISAKREFAAGAMVRSMDWTDAGKILSRLTRCPLK